MFLSIHWFGNRWGNGWSFMPFQHFGFLIPWSFTEPWRWKSQMPRWELIICHYFIASHFTINIILDVFLINFSSYFNDNATHTIWGNIRIHNPLECPNLTLTHYICWLHYLSFNMTFYDFKINPSIKIITRIW